MLDVSLSTKEREASAEIAQATLRVRKVNLLTVFDSSHNYMLPYSENKFH
jgi:hypothetical protein